MKSFIKYIFSLLFLFSPLFATEIQESQYTKTWKSYYGPIGGRISSISISPSDPAILYAATMNSLYKTTDGAKSWFKVNKNRSYTTGSIAIHPKKPETLVIAGNKIEISDDGGRTRRDFSKDDSFKNVYISSICYAGSDSIFLLALSGDKVFRYDDAERKWKQVHKVTGDKNYGNFELTADIYNPDVLSVKSQYSPRFIDFSLDAGTTWRHFPVPDQDQLRAFGTHHKKKDILLYVNENRAAYFSADKGESWEVFFHPNDNAYAKDEIIDAVRAISPDIPRTRFYSYYSGIKLAINPQDSRIVYYAPFSGGIQKTTDGGLNWKYAQDGIIATDVKKIFAPIAGRSGLACFSSMGTYIFQSEKKRWKTIEPPQMQDAYYTGGGIFAIDPNKKSRFIIGDGMGRTFISEDSGENWSRFANFEHPNVYNRIFQYVFYPDKKDICIAIAASGIYKCNFKTGDTSQISEFLTEPSESTWGLVALFNPNDMKTVFVIHNSWGSKGKLSNDTGKTWNEIKIPFSPQMGEIPVFDISPDGSIWGISNKNLWKLPASSKEWQQIEGPQKYNQLKTITVSKNKNEILYVADFERKVWITRDAGKSWKNLGKLDDDITCLFEHPDDGNLFAGTQSSGVMIYSEDADSVENKSE